MSGEDTAVSFPPEVSEATRVMVLGSMPGRRSLELGQYYAHPRNRLWPVLTDLIRFGEDLDYERRMRGALEAGLGFWDVLKHCERPGSLDAAIRRKSEVPNDFGWLLRRYPRIQALAFNGRKARLAFWSHVEPQLSRGSANGIELLELPSTSPANAAFSYEQLRESWSVVRDRLMIV